MGTVTTINAFRERHRVFAEIAKVLIDSDIVARTYLQNQDETHANGLLSVVEGLLELLPPQVKLLKQKTGE